MRTVLVCVRTPLAAQHLTSAAARLGLSAIVRTAVSDPEVMLRLAERPADVVLADTALTRPDSAGFVRRVLARAPQAAVLLLGTEESEAAAATISAGARGLIQNVDHDLTSAVAKALLLLTAPGRASRQRITDPARDAAAVGGCARRSGRRRVAPASPAGRPGRRRAGRRAVGAGAAGRRRGGAGGRRVARRRPTRPGPRRTPGPAGRRSASPSASFRCCSAWPRARATRRSAGSCSSRRTPSRRTPAGCSASSAPGTGRTRWRPASGPAWSPERAAVDSDGRAAPARRSVPSVRRVVHPVGVAAGVVPGHVVVRVGVVGRLVHPGPAGVEQVAQVAAEQVPVEVVRLAAVLALDHQPADPDRAPAAPGRSPGRRGPPARPAARRRSAGRRRRRRRVVQARGRVGRVAVERVDGLVVHPLTVDPRARSPPPCLRRPACTDGPASSLGTMRRRAVTWRAPVPRAPPR